MKLTSFQKTILTSAIIALVVLIFSAVTFGKRVLLPEGLIEAVRSFFASGGELRACDYKDGEILLLKPIATGVGEGRAEAGDIAEIRDGETLCQRFGGGNFLGDEERTTLLPVYYKGKLTEEQKKELTEPEMENCPPRTAKTEDSPPKNCKMLMLRQWGVDYTLVLSDREILKARNFEKLDRIPEIDLSAVIKKSNAVSVVHLPAHLALYESVRHSVSNIAQKIFPSAMADGVETVKTVDTGGYADYISLNAWNIGQQGDIRATARNEIAIAKCQHKTATSTADTEAVTIDGWTTDSTHYIKIWTDPTESYRHNGKWDATKYYMNASTRDILNYENDVLIDGLQFTTSGTPDELIVEGAGAGGRLQIYNSIFAASIYFAINEAGADGQIIKIKNSLFYNFTQRPLVPIYGTWYIYNCTIIGSGNRGIYAYGGTTYAKNVISKGNSVADFDVYLGALTCTNCASGDGTADDFGGSGNRVNQTFLFADFANSDFHLAYADTGAKGYGTSTPYSSVTDANLSFTDDIDGQTRPSFGTNWDIGADQYQATPIYRSVGRDKTSTLAAGPGTSNNLSISGNTATFTTGLANNIGVGDALVYTSTEGTGSTATNSIAFISGRSSPTSYSVQDVAGKMASSTYSVTTNWAIYRAYNRLSRAESGTENTGLPDALEQFDAAWSPSGGKNLASSTEQWNIACYGDAPDTTAVTISGWTTTADNYIKIYTPYLPSEVGTSQRHSGKWDSTKYNLVLTNSASFPIYNYLAPHLRIDGLQIFMNGPSGGVAGIDTWGVTGNEIADIRISNNIIKSTAQSVYETDGIVVWNVGIGSKVSVWNNLIYDLGKYSVGGDDDSTGIKVWSAVSNYYNFYAYNNTVVNAYRGYTLDPNFPTYYTAKNNIAQNCIDGFYASWYGSWDNADSDYNISNIAGDAPGSHSKNGVKVTFASAAGYDFHLSPSDVWAKDNGTNLSADSNLAFSTDIDNNPRPMGPAWDIGADETRGTQINTPITGYGSQSGLVGNWSFNGPDMNATTAIDRSGSNNDGDVIGGAQKVPGISGQALKFDGVDGHYINAGSASSLDDLGPLTYSLWLYPKGGNAWGEEYFVCKHLWNSGYIFIAIDWLDPAQIYFLKDYNGASDLWVRTDAVLDHSYQWSHLVVTWDGSNLASGVHIYVNGIEQGHGAETDGAGSKNSDANNNLIIGAVEDGTRVFNGLIDEVRVYNRALSASEITDLYRAGAARLKVNTPTSGYLTSGLVGNWTFNGQDTTWTSATAGTTNDLSGNGNTGTMTNMSRSTSPVPGISGQALSFDGSDDYVSMGSDVVGTGADTIAAWIYAKSYGKGGLGIIHGNGQAYFTLSLTNTRLAFTSDSFNTIVYSGTNSILLNQWYFVAVTRTADGTASFYVNGVLSGAPASSGNPAAGNASNIGDDGGSTYNFNGLIDEARIYNRALSADEILQLYRIGASRVKFKQ